MTSKVADDKIILLEQFFKRKLFRALPWYFSAIYTQIKEKTPQNVRNSMLAINDQFVLIHTRLHSFVFDAFFGETIFKSAFEFWATKAFQSTALLLFFLPIFVRQLVQPDHFLALGFCFWFKFIHITRAVSTFLRISSRSISTLCLIAYFRALIQ